MHDRDIQQVRIIGTLIAGIGLILMLLTGLTTLFVLFGGAAATAGNGIVRGGLTILLAFIMSFSLTSCGAEIQRVKLSTANIENLRLVWTALIILMALSLGAGLWLAQPLAFLAALVLLTLFSIRGAIIRLTRQY
ncbi:MAG: hypothetical protein JWN01_658 [Patescibacteria group bacterium]|nr:hypothetical protein [Patescibacteria group bacterium]